MVVTAQSPNWAPEPDTEKHVPDICFRAWGNSTRLCAGWWFTSDIPILSLVGNDPNATNIRLTGFKYISDVDWGGPAPNEGASLLVDLDGSRIVDRALARAAEPTEKTEVLDSILAGSDVAFGLWQQVYPGVGSWADQHIWNYAVFGTYETTTPLEPRTLTLRVYDPVAAEPIVGATVYLLSGQTPVDTDKTDSSGMVTLQGFNKTYSFKVYASRYTPSPYEDSVDLTLGNIGPLDIPLTYVGDGFELPWWWWIPVVGIGGVIATWVLVKAVKPSKRREEPPVYVIK